MTITPPHSMSSTPMEPPRSRTGSSWSFPYPQPYSIQLDLMQALYDAVERRQIGVFESPTGTGKSLSLICATFTWLKGYAERVERGEVSSEAGQDQGADEDDDDPPWVKQQAEERRRRERMRHEEELKERIEAVRRREAALKAEAARQEKVFGGAFAGRKRVKAGGAGHIGAGKQRDDSDGESDSDDVFLPSDLPADSAFKSPWHSSASAPTDDLDVGPALRAMMARYKSRGTPNDKNELDELPETTPKIIYACRTHSQLSQFVAELKKTPFGRDLAEEDIDGATPSVRVIPLGSRKQMCINEKVQKLGTRAGNEAMNEACRDLISSSSKSKRCAHLPAMDASGQAQVLDFRDRAMAQVRDIEDLVEMGREMNTCPYYASRTSAKQAQLITLPYNLLLQKNARESLGISLKDSVIIIDEAHNLIDTILGIYTISLTSTQIITAKGQINEYLKRFGSRLRGESEMHLRMLRKLSEGMERAVGKWVDTGMDEVVWTADKMVSEMGGNADTVHFAELEKFLKQSQIARKVSGYAEKIAAKEREKGGTGIRLSSSAIAAMHSIESFILSLSNKSQDGRVLLTRDKSATPPTVQLKYQLLNPSESFTELAEEARSIILAGGTMEPLAELQSQLMPTVARTRLTHFASGHIVPSSNLFCSVVLSGPRGAVFDFKYDKRGDTKVLDDLGNALANFSALIPHGIVVFLPSYKFLDEIVARWKRSEGGSTSTWARLSSRKKIFLEPRESSEVDGVLQAYSSAIDQPAASTVTGALLLAVVGAKLSEGINFSDRLARAVIMVGMPYPNSKSAELVERMEYARKQRGPNAGQELYTNICMKAVNQSIGRAIRHQNDFAALILLDQRYGRADVRKRLPGWIRDHVHVQSGFGGVMKDLGVFFRDKRSRGLL